MPSLNHIHSYVRLRGRKGRHTPAEKTNRYKCADPNCSHTLTREMAEGKNCRCACGEIFVLSYKDLNLARPMCLNCSGTAEARRHKAARQLMESVLLDDLGSLRTGSVDSVE